jgi:SHS2 domain-containing protein
MPFEEVPHTADWCLHVWAADLALLFVEAARGMNAISGARAAAGTATHRILDLSGPDPESLLVAFLSELVFYAEHEHLIFLDFQIGSFNGSDGRTVHIDMDGAPLASINKTIKAVTYHNLHIRQTERGIEIEIVFDV